MSEPTPPPPQPYGGYTPAPYGTTPTGTPLAPRTNTLAIVALVLSLTVSLGGIICGHIALSQIKRTGEGGHGLALAGTIIGYVLTGFWVLYFVIVIAAVIFSVSMAGTYGTYS
jgi:hypothetical protein